MTETTTYTPAALTAVGYRKAADTLMAADDFPGRAALITDMLNRADDAQAIERIATHAVAKGQSDYYAGKITQLDDDGTVHIIPRAGHSAVLEPGTYRLLVRN